MCGARLHQSPGCSIALQHAQLHIQWGWAWDASTVKQASRCLHGHLPPMSGGHHLLPINMPVTCPGSQAPVPSPFSPHPHAPQRQGQPCTGSLVCCCRLWGCPQKRGTPTPSYGGWPSPGTRTRLTRPCRSSWGGPWGPSAGPTWTPSMPCWRCCAWPIDGVAAHAPARVPPICHKATPTIPQPASRTGQVGGASRMYTACRRQGIGLMTGGISDQVNRARRHRCWGQGPVWSRRHPRPLLVGLLA